MRILPCVALAFALASCGQKETSEVSSVTPEIAAKLVGTYAGLLRLSTFQEIPVVGKLNFSSRLYSLVDISFDGTALTIKEQSCRSEFEGGSVLKFAISDATVQATPPSVAPLRVWEEDGQVKIARDSLTLLYGAKLQNPATDKLPTSVDDKRLVDVDQDGKPGITAQVSGALIGSGDAYLVQRTIGSFTGSALDSGNLQGVVTDSVTDQVVLKTTLNFVVNGLLSGKKVISELNKDELSTVSFARLNGEANCAAVIAAKDSL